MEFLLEDRELNEAGLWMAILNTEEILESRNISIKREGYTILSNVMSHGAEVHVISLSNKFE